MRDQGSGRIVNVTSLARQQGSEVNGAHYAASKAGLLALTKMVARELSDEAAYVTGATLDIDGAAFMR